jgi:hypothetical protein
LFIFWKYLKEANLIIMPQYTGTMPELVAVANKKRQPQKKKNGVIIDKINLASQSVVKGENLPPIKLAIKDLKNQFIGLFKKDDDEAPGVSVEPSPADEPQCIKVR